MSIILKFLKKIGAFLMSGVFIFVSFFDAPLGKVDVDSLRYALLNAFASYCDETTSDEVKAFKEKTGGFMKGVCHPNENYEQIADANIEWVRFDCTSLPFDSEGNPNPGYLAYKERAKSYADRGFKVMCITPYPSKYIDAGLDPRDKKNEQAIKDIAKFYATDLQGIVSAFQITNEMGIEHFTLPLTLEEAARFIGIQMEAMKDVKGNIVVGFNNAGTKLYNLTELMMPYMDVCDYVAMDIYLGCFENILKDIRFYDLILRSLWHQTHKPILLNKFGYIGYGKTKTAEEKKEILRSYGVGSEEEARKDIFAFIDKLPPDFRDHMLSLEYSSEKELADKLFNTELSNHLYRELKDGFKMKDYDHTPEDQARFFTDCIARLSNLDFLCAAFVYCYCDSDACYICGQEDCPVETGWGLVDLHGEPKPAYYAVKEAFGKIK